MILQEFVFGQGTFWGLPAALERWPIVLHCPKIGIVIFYGEKGARLNLSAEFLGVLFLR